MAINLGVALGNAATSGVNTYDRMQQLRIQQEQHAFEQERQDQLRQEWGREAARNAAYAKMPPPTDSGDAQSVSDYLDQNYNFTPEQKAALMQGIAADPSKAPAVLAAYAPQFRKGATPQAAPTPPAAGIPQSGTTNTPGGTAAPGEPDPGLQARAMPQALPGAGPQAAPIWNGAPNPNAGVSTQGALPDYTGGVASPTPSPTEEAQAPAPAPSPAQPINPAKPPVTDSGIDVSKYHGYLGHDGKVYLSTGKPREPSPAEILRYHATELMKLPDEKAQAQGSALLQQSYAMAKQEHVYQLDQVMDQVRTGKISAQDAMAKMAGVVSDGSTLPGKVNVQLAPDGKSATITHNVPGGQPSTQTITGDNALDILGKMRVGAESLYEPSLYLHSAQNKIAADQAMSHRITAEAEKSKAASTAALVPSEIEKNQGAAKYYSDHGAYMRNRASAENKQEQMIENYAHNLLKTGQAKTIEEARVMAYGAKFHDPNANQNKDLTQTEQIGLQAVQKDLSELPKNATDADIRAIYNRHGVGHLYKDTFGDTIRKNMPKPGGSFFGGGNPGKVAPTKSSAPSAIPATQATSPTGMRPVARDVTPGMRAVDLPQRDTDDPLLRQQLGVETRGIPPFEDPLFSPIGRVLNGQAGR